MYSDTNDSRLQRCWLRPCSRAVALQENKGLGVSSISNENLETESLLVDQSTSQPTWAPGYSCTVNKRMIYAIRNADLAAVTGHGEFLSTATTCINL
jgi:hypothetical protein